MANRINPADRAAKDIEPLLRVYVWTVDGFLQAGLLQLAEEGDRQMNATFEYDRDYLSHPLSYPLDPINMPLGTRAFATVSPLVILGSIFDAAPDAWGRRVVRASVDPSEQHQIYRNAFLRGADGIGSLLLTPDRDMDLDAIVADSLRERPALSELTQAARAARSLEDGVELDDAARALLAGSWTIGGARPKAILRDDRPGALPGASVIAKFESAASEQDGRNRLEWATLAMAKELGLQVPAHDLVELDGQSVLVLERFDRHIRADGQVQRRHYVSAASFISAKPTGPYLDSAHDTYHFSWKRLLEVTAQVSESASQGRNQMFARLVFNAATHNTDDHAKNYGFLRLVDDPVHYDVAPMFDISPQTGRTHYLSCGALGRHYTLAEVVNAQVVRGLGMSKVAAAVLRDKILTVLERRQEFFEKAGMSEGQMRIANAWIEMGCGEIKREPKLAHRTPVVESSKPV